jgi:hypothetical protein
VSLAAGITSNVLSFGSALPFQTSTRTAGPMFISAMISMDRLPFINNRNGTFTERLSECMDEISMFSMGSDFVIMIMMDCPT